MEEKKKLKTFMKDYFCFSRMKEAKIFPKEMKFNDYEGQAKIICDLFELNSIYDYEALGKGTRYHASYIDTKTDITRPFVQVIGGENKEDCKIIKFPNP
jgi:hypothetical protein